MFTINGEWIEYKRLKLRLGVEKLNEIKLHEKTRRELAVRLATEIKEEGVQRDPIIVDEKTKVVLDGSHRVEALRILGADKALICGVDYTNPLIRVYRWIRCVKCTNSQLVDALSNHMVSYEETDAISAFNAVVSRTRIIAILGYSRSFLSRRPFTRALDSYYESEKIETRLRRSKLEVFVIPDSQFTKYLVNGYYLVFPPLLTKDEVIESGVRGEPYPPKTTRHLIPARPVQVEYPLKYLLDTSISLHEAQEKLRDILNSRRVNIVPPNTWYRGRVYEEPLIIFK